MATSTTARPLGPGFRTLSGLEFLLAAGLVIGHNVFRVLPNEVIFLAVAGLISARVRDGGWASIGLGRPRSWLTVILLAVAAAAIRLGVGDFVLVPFAEQWWPAPKESIGALGLGPGKVEAALTTLLLVWTFAAFGEEIAYRGYLTTRAADLGGRTPVAFWIAMVIAAVLFGVGHWYKGPAGVLDSTFAGLVLGTAYLISGRSLWTSILAHGLIDTTAVTLIFFGLVE